MIHGWLCRSAGFGSVAPEPVHSSGAPQLEIFGECWFVLFLDDFYDFFGCDECGFFFLKFVAMRRESGGGLKLAELPEKMSRLKHVGETLTEQERAAFLQEAHQNLDVDVDFELFLRVTVFWICVFSAFNWMLMEQCLGIGLRVV